jgi:hypothetical protein
MDCLRNNIPVSTEDVNRIVRNFLSCLQKLHNFTTQIGVILICTAAGRAEQPIELIPRNRVELQNLAFA